MRKGKHSYSRCRDILIFALMEIGMNPVSYGLHNLKQVESLLHQSPVLFAHEAKVGILMYQMIDTLINQLLVSSSLSVIDVCVI